MQLIKQDINIDFVGKTRLAGFVSLALVLASLGSLVIQGGPKYGIDFAGGTLIQVKFTEPTSAREIRDCLSGIASGDAAVQPFGDTGSNEFLVNIQKTVSDLEGLSEQAGQAFAERFGADSHEIRRVEMVGPKVGRELRQKGFMAVICSLVGMLVYIWWRFEFRFGIGAIIALVHDVVITMGALSITGTSIDLPIIAALLTVVGYSVNDTIIVCDRIRENRRKMVRENLARVINMSINNTLSRTLMTSVTTLLVVVTLFVYGGGVIHDFAFTLLVGILVGTYSSIFIASPVLILWENMAHDRKRSTGSRKK